MIDGFMVKSQIAKI